MHKVQMQQALKKHFINGYKKQYMKMFETIRSATKADMQTVIDSFPPKVFYEQIKNFLSSGGYVPEENLVLLKQDPFTMLNLFRIHGIHYCVRQQEKLTEKLK